MTHTLLRHITLIMFCVIIAGCAARRDAPSGPSPYVPAPQEHPYNLPHSAIIPPQSQDETPSNEAVLQGKPVKVALLLPLTGKSSALGQAILDAAMLGLFDKYASIKDQSVRPITLLPKDTAGEAKQAKKAMQSALDEGAMLVIGPLFSASVNAVAPLARKAKIPVISLSNNQAVAGDGVYLFGFMPQEQMQRLAQYARLQGVEQLAAIIPDNPYGQLIDDTLSDYAALQGLPPVSIQYYQSDGRDVAQAVQRIAEQAKLQRSPPGAIILAEQGQVLNRLLDKVQQYGLRQETLLLGPSLWDDTTQAGNAALDGAYFVSAPRRGYSQFIARFEHVEGYTPPRLASLGYDAVTLAATMLQYGGFAPASLQQPSGFVSPANGMFRLRKDGTVERSLSVLQFDGGAIAEVRPAPRMFVN